MLSELVFNIYAHVTSHLESHVFVFLCVFAFLCVCVFSVVLFCVFAVVLQTGVEAKLEQLILPDLSLACLVF